MNTGACSRKAPCRRSAARTSAGADEVVVAGLRLQPDARLASRVRDRHHKVRSRRQQAGAPGWSCRRPDGAEMTYSVPRATGSRVACEWLTSMFCTCSRICSISTFISTAVRVVSRSCDLRRQRVGLAIELLHQEIQPPTGRLVRSPACGAVSSRWPLEPVEFLGHIRAAAAAAGSPARRAPDRPARPSSRSRSSNRCAHPARAPPAGGRAP